MDNLFLVTPLLLLRLINLLRLPHFYIYYKYYSNHTGISGDYYIRHYVKFQTTIIKSICYSGKNRISHNVYLLTLHTTYSPNAIKLSRPKKP